MYDSMMKNPLSQKLVQLEQAEYRFSIKLMMTQTLRIFLHQSFYLIYLRKGTLQDIYVINLQHHLPMQENVMCLYIMILQCQTSVIFRTI